MRVYINLKLIFTFSTLILNFTNSNNHFFYNILVLWTIRGITPNRYLYTPSKVLIRKTNITSFYVLQTTFSFVCKKFQNQSSEQLYLNILTWSNWLICTIGRQRKGGGCGWNLKLLPSLEMHNTILLADTLSRLRSEEHTCISVITL
jgi:hypothetical protein